MKILIRILSILALFAACAVSAHAGVPHHGDLALSVMFAGVTAADVNAAIQANMAARMALLHTGTPMRKNLGVFNANPLGQKTRIKLDNVGVLTSVDVVVTASLDIGVHVPSISATGAEALLPLIKLKDYNGVDRVQASARHLRVLNSAKARFLFDGYYRTYDSDDTNINLGEALLRQVPTAVANASPFRFSVRIPVAYDPNSDLRGAILAQVVNGEMFIELTTAGAFQGADADSVYIVNTGSTVALHAGTTVQYEVFMNYIQPQSIAGAGLPLPKQDLLTAYEINGALQSSDSFAVNQAKHIYYPNVRQVLSAILTYTNNGALNYGTDITSLIVQANSNTTITEDDGKSILDRQRRLVGSDLIGGTYYFDHRRVPVDTQEFGNVQVLLTPSNVGGGNLYEEHTFESFYLLGAELPGIQVG